ncbi:phosphatase PAP2 family protein [Clostridium psychrophilum]|uniref:phosphatase PAP2 family protein n=1 Tax=Clostridium psychrophilum TaxID=132926 RepID=UPI001C0C09FE|nr:phosphatase PAP2 family protein [Clostridium psychrophilum]MBU3182183.1 phosphatase PAP2 family protein [Clostridium psychrophilum]
MIALIQKFDSSILLYIKDNMHGLIMDKIMVISTYLGNGGIVWIIIIAILLISKKYRRIGLMALAALILSTILGDIVLKNVVKRIRPSSTIPAINLLISNPLSYSFPSGHTTSSFAVAGVLTRYFKSYALEFFSLASLIAFSRLYLYVHYPTDVLGGIVLGLICSGIIIFLFDKVSCINCKAEHNTLEKK